MDVKIAGFLLDLFCFCAGYALFPWIIPTVMGPAHRFRSNRGAVAPRDPLAPPPFGGEGNRTAWARRVQKWVRAHEALCAQNDKRGFPAYLRGYLLSEALYGTAFRTVESTIPEDVINSNEGVDAIISLLAKFNPTTAAHEIFAAYKGLMQIRRGSKESFKLYVNRFEAAASELRSLTGQESHGEAEQLLAFQLLEGAQIPTAVFLQVLTNCLDENTKDASSKEEGSPAGPVLSAMKDEIQTVREFDSEALARVLHGVEKTKAEEISSLFKDAMRKVADSFGNTHKQLSRLLSKERNFSTSASAAAAVTIDFESAKKALRALDAVSVEAKTGDSQQHITAGDRSAIQQIVRQTLLSHQAAEGNIGTPPRGRRSRAGKQRRVDFSAQIARRKANSTCAACKGKGHWAGDPECPKTKKGGSNGTMLASSTGNEKGEDEESPVVFFH